MVAQTRTREGVGGERLFYPKSLKVKLAAEPLLFQAPGDCSESFLGCVCGEAVSLRGKACNVTVATPEK